MTHTKRFVTGVVLTLLVGSLTFFGLSYFYQQGDQTSSNLTWILPSSGSITPNPTPTPTPTPTPIPSQYQLQGGYQTFQTFNNCGPASLSMALSHHDISVSQQVLGNKLRPYQVPGGDNDDKSVTLEELAAEADNFGLVTYHRPSGSIELLEHLVAQDLPVITRTLTKVGEDIGHYRVVKGYDQYTNTLLQDDSLQGANLTYTYQEFNSLWQPYNYEFLVLVPPSQVPTVEIILGPLLDPQQAWTIARNTAHNTLRDNPQDFYAKFNLSVAFYHLGKYQAAIDAYEAVESRLPFRTLWYQLEPLYAYYELGQYQTVLAKSQTILEGGNRAYSELYELRSKVFEQLGNSQAAQEELALATRYRQPR